MPVQMAAIQDSESISESVALGFRVETKVIRIAVVRRRGQELAYEVMPLNLPLALEDPQQLTYVRSNLLDVMREAGARFAGIRTGEHVSRGGLKASGRRRIMIEGVLMELIASGSAESYVIGAKATLASRLNVTHDEIGKLIEGTSSWLGSDGWVDLKSNEREAVLIAAASLP